MPGERRDGYRSGNDARREADRHRDDRRNERYEDWRSYCPPTCFACGEPGHYANQCPDKDRRRYAERPSTSSDYRQLDQPRRADYRRRHDSPPGDGGEIRNNVAELGKSVGVMKDFFDEAGLRKEERERKKREKEAEALEAAEREQQEKKAKKREEKCKRELDLEAQRREDAMEENFAHKVDSVIGPIRDLIELGKNKVPYAAKSVPLSYEESDTSFTQELSAQTERLCIADKRKRGPEPEFDDNPPMELPPKRTPKRGVLKPTGLARRLTRARTVVKSLGSIKRKSPVKTPLSAKGKKKLMPRKLSAEICTPTSKGALRRLCFLDSMMKELKDLDATELQRLCKEEGVPYDGKIDAIFAIADNRAREKFSLDVVDPVDVIAIDVSDVSAPPKEAQDE
ncbi:hypothetical protein CBR_g37469 [Chara braunii]|uniref:CCHC-type domain-containing protein n=1 Tax=Chara braunii TaxID=69332 RepID=A0A388LMW5_CHABU|nr:hypothetical protein CBR_g37469 [Chara braunii]|eukprot:GBG83667.1 hypothetical protein CBR_g37469 [Chara braunii]